MWLDVVHRRLPRIDAFITCLGKCRRSTFEAVVAKIRYQARRAVLDKSPHLGVERAAINSLV